MQQEQNGVRLSGFPRDQFRIWPIKWHARFPQITKFENWFLTTASMLQRRRFGLDQFTHCELMASVQTSIAGWKGIHRVPLSKRILIVTSDSRIIATTHHLSEHNHICKSEIPKSEYYVSRHLMYPEGYGMHLMNRDAVFAKIISDMGVTKVLSKFSCPATIKTALNLPFRHRCCRYALDDNQDGITKNVFEWTLWG